MTVGKYGGNKLNLKKKTKWIRISYGMLDDYFYYINEGKPLILNDYFIGGVRKGYLVWAIDNN